MLFCRAQSGTGKTATYSIGVLQSIDTQTRETQSRLTSTAVLLGKIHSKLVQNGARVALQRSVQRAVSIHYNETECIIILKKLVQGLVKRRIMSGDKCELYLTVNTIYLSVELVVAKIQ